MVPGYEPRRVRDAVDAVMEPEPLIGGRYECGPVIGRGGMAEVRAGRDTRLDRPVAIKLLRAVMDHQPVVRRRFETEARIAARLVHPNVVTVFDSGEGRSGPFIVMERLPGSTLRDRIARGPMPVPEVRSVAVQVLAAMGAAHAAGIVHRDIKPGNILLGRDGQWKVADFGIAKIAERQITDDTVTGLVIGTPAYLAPERFFGADATVEADLYSLGAVLYESLTGRKPLQAPSTGAWATIASTTVPAPLRAVCPEADAALANAVERCLTKDPDERFPSAAAMTAALSGPVVEAARTPPGATTDGLDTTPPLAVEIRPQAQSSYRRRTVIGGLAVIALGGILAAVIGLGAAGDSSGAVHHPSAPSTTPAPAARPSSPSPSPSTSAVPPPSSPPAAASASASTHRDRRERHGDKGKGNGGGHGHGHDNGNN